MSEQEFLTLFNIPGAASVPCTGDSFSTFIASQPIPYDVTGSVACGQTTITGTVEGDAVQTYTATLGACEN